MNFRYISALLAAVLLAGAALGLPRGQAAAVVATSLVTGAGAGVYPSGATFSGVQLAGGTYGLGVQIHDDGSAIGDLEAQYNGSSLIGLQQDITVRGWLTSGTVNPDNTVTLNGTCTLDMGDGSVPSTGVPLVATVSLTGFTLTVGASVFPTLPKADGWIFME